MVSQIQYPYALDEDRQPVHVDGAVSGHKYTCVGCGQSMLYRQGKSARSHFAHRASSDKCTPLDAYKVMSKFELREVLNDAISGGGQYVVVQRCLRCRDELLSAVIAFNVNMDVVTDHPLSGDITVSVALVENGVVRVGFEVGMDTPLTAEQISGYQASGSRAPVYFRGFRISSKDEILNKFVSSDSINVRGAKCNRCEISVSGRRGVGIVVPRQGSVRNDDQGASEPSNVSSSSEDDSWSVREARLPFNPWVKDARGRLIRARVRERIYSSALLLTEIGFHQSVRPDRPYVFLYRQAGQVLFANFSAPYQPPVWKDPSALLHGASDARIEDMNPTLYKEIVKKCRDVGAEVSVPAKYRFLDFQETPIAVSPVFKVDSVLLASICAVGDLLYEEAQGD